MDMQAEAASYLVSVRPLLYRPGEKRNVEVAIDAETAAGFGMRFTQLPVVKGVLENRAGVLFFRYTAEGVADLECDRCLASVAMHMNESFEHIVVTETATEQNDSDYLLTENAMLDIAETVMTDLRLALPSKILCSEDCLGICPCCGANRNQHSCNCQQA
ncbi:MAG: DUF177 domain-containing protein [Oscillospiraceae bacterium]|nr:DUF177 domain-containing protein [Oscillospiraceae bacterium]